VKACFRQTRNKKAFTSYENSGTKSIATITAHTPRTTSSHMCCRKFHNQNISRTMSSLVYSFINTKTSDCVLVCLFTHHNLQSRTMSSLVYLFFYQYIDLGLCPRLFIHNQNVISGMLSSIVVLINVAGSSAFISFK
jgi:hypothetical protein